MQSTRLIHMRWWLLAACCLGSCSAMAQDRAVIVGGGYNVQGSQAQIERNVLWVQEILQQSSLRVRTFFNDGNDETPDIHYQLPEENNNSKLTALATVFGNARTDRRRYRNHTVENVTDGTHRDTLLPALGEILKDSTADSALLIFNGHGQPSNSTADNVALDLWGNSQLTAAELHALLGDRRKPFRFLFTQCYSGGFHRLAYADSATGLKLAEGERCGFTSESSYRQAEGCSASIDTTDYRDYSTYFFAALTGYDRDGEILSSDPDVNTDGQTTLREAHLYTLEKAFSSDLSRSTSEDFLTSWQPWYLKWLPANPTVPNNEYSRVSRELAVRASLTLDDNLARTVREKLMAYEQQHAELSLQQQDLLLTTRRTQIELQQAAVGKWPALSGPYTEGFQTLVMKDQLPAISAWLENQALYAQLLEMGKTHETMQADLLELERNATQMQKILRMRKLATLKKQLLDYGSPDEVASYESLLRCEDQPLTATAVRQAEN